MKPETYSELRCPNCASTDFEQVDVARYRCTYCGACLSTSSQPPPPPPLPREAAPPPVKCPRCGHENAFGDQFCNNCGRVLVGKVTGSSKLDPAVISVIVSLVGNAIFPVIGAVIGLFLGYRALKEATTPEMEKRARLAIGLGLLILALSIVMMCLAMARPALEFGWLTCQGLYREFEDFLMSQ